MSFRTNQYESQCLEIQTTKDFKLLFKVQWIPNPWLAYPDYHMLVLPGHAHLLLVYLAVKMAVNKYSANIPAS